jgi:PTS system galactitol-specific IIC component
MSPFFTQAAQQAGFKMPENAAQITSIADGFLWPGWLFTTLSSMAGIFGVLIILVLLVVVWFFYAKNPRAWEIAAGAPKE